jgi:hypothetical protein
MPGIVAENNPSSLDHPPTSDAIRFLNALFAPCDYVLVRPVETWTEDSTRKKSRVVYSHQRWRPAAMLATEESWQSLLAISEEHRANLFFGVCPRLGQVGQFDLSWQIRTVRVLWADLDHCTVAEARQRCHEAGLLPPSIVVCSGNGVHLYWILAEPFLIDDVGSPPAVLTEWIDQGQGKRIPRKYIQGENGQRIHLHLPNGRTPNPDCPWGQLSAKARLVQDVLAGLASKIGGDHTSDLARCLRLPGTLNRKDERNGRQPVPCALVECDSARRYPFADFEALALAAPESAPRGSRSNTAPSAT